MKSHILSVALAAIPALAIAPQSAEAQFGGGIVYDPANHTQNILSAVRALEEITNQVQQLAHEIEMLENMARDLERLPDSVASDIRARMQRIEDLMRRAEGIGYGVQEVEREYEEIYPETYGETPPDAQILVDDARQRWRQSRSAYRQSLTVTAGIVETSRADSESLNALLGQSQGAAGNLQALQAGNQIEALQTEQLMQIESMMAAHYRAEALNRARELAEETRGRARTQSFLGN